MSDRLSGKIVLVTGAAQGIGAAIGTLMSKEAATVVASDLTAESAQAGVLDAHHVIALDVSQPSAWQAAAEEVERRYGRLDVLVNNAGVATGQALEQCTLEDWRLHMTVNAEGAFLGIKTFLPLLKLGGKRRPAGASVVNIASVASLIGVPNQAAYNSSKAAVRQLSRSLAIEFAAHGFNIRVNAIHPGIVRTPLMLGALEKWRAAGNVKEATEEAAAAIVPMKRIAMPEDIGYGAVYLASDEAAYITGAELTIDGGWTAQ